MRVQKYVHKYVRIPPVRIGTYLLQIRTEYVYVKRLMDALLIAEVCGEHYSSDSMGPEFPATIAPLCQ